MAELTSLNVNDTGFLRLPQGSTAQRPETPNSGFVRYNTSDQVVEYYDGNTWVQLSKNTEASGGNYTVEYEEGGNYYRVHVFTSTGNFNVNSAGEVEYLIVAGGGGGGSSPNNPNDACGGGGAGGFITGRQFVNPQNYTATVGAGGASVNSSVTPGSDGAPSSIFGVNAVGGGGGASQNRPGRAGGSGGGAGNGGGSGPYLGGAGTAGQGNAGGNITSSSTPWIGGGGGGAGEAGRSGDPGTTDVGKGGDGLRSSITGYGTFFAGGGGGGAPGGALGGGGGTAPASDGGFGGGAQGGDVDDPNNTAPAGGINTGGGGGGAMGYTSKGGGAGGSGIIALRYKINNLNKFPRTFSSEDHPTLASGYDAGDIQTYPSKARIIEDRRGILDLTFINGTYTAEYGGALRFNGSNSRIGQSNSAALNVDDNVTPRAWEVWAKPNASQNEAGIFGHKTAASCTYYCNGGIFITNGKWAFNWYDNSTYRFLDSGVTASAGQYYHVLCVFDRSKRPVIYVNGEFRARFGSETNFNFSGGMELVDVGWNSKEGGREYFNGDIAIFNLYIDRTFARDPLGEGFAKQRFEAGKRRFGL